LEEERTQRFTRVGAAQLFPGFNTNGNNIFSNIINHQNVKHISINKQASMNELKWRQKTSENRGFPTRHAETQRKEPIHVSLQNRAKELKYDLAERMRSRKLKTLGYESDEAKNNDKSYKNNIVLRKKKVILEGSDTSDRAGDSDADPGERTHRAITNATRNNTIASTTNYLTAATGNKNTVMKSSRSRVSSQGSDED
jgi:preprotein translocase subunit SecD